MAHVGTTTNLKQPAATGSGRQAGVWTAVIAAAVIAAIALAFVMTQLVGSKAANGSLAGDRSYDQIEAQRGAVTSVAGDRSYDQIEAQRGAGTYLAPDVLDRGADRGAPTSIVPRDHAYDALHPAWAPVPGSIQLKRGFNRDLQP
jgi:hypothetical protein